MYERRNIMKNIIKAIRDSIVYTAEAYYNTYVRL